MSWEGKFSVRAKDIESIQLIFPERYDIIQSMKFSLRPTERVLFRYKGELENRIQFSICNSYGDNLVSVEEEIFDVTDKKPTRDTIRKFSFKKFSIVGHDSIEYLLGQLRKKLESTGYEYTIKEYKKCNYRAYRKPAVKLNFYDNPSIIINVNDMKTAESVYQDLISQLKCREIISYDKNNISKC